MSGIVQTSGRRFTAVILSVCAVALLISPSPALSAQPDAPDDDKQKVANADESTSGDQPLVIPGQPGDDELTELKSDFSRQEESTQESLSWYMVGTLAQEKGDFPEALKAFRKSHDANPDSPAPLRSLAFLSLQLRQIQNAEDYANDVVERDPDDYEVVLLLARLAAARDQGEKAIEYYERAIASERLDKASIEAVMTHRSRAVMLLRIGKLEEAADSLEVVLDALIYPERFNLDFREHEALIRDQAIGFAQIGTVLMTAGRHEKAVEAFEAQERLSGNEPGVQSLQLANAWMKLKAFDKAEEQLDRYFSADLRDRESLELFKELLTAQGREDEFLPRLRELANSGSADSACKYYLAEQLAEADQNDEAESLLRATIAQSGDPEGFLGLARLYLRLKRHGPMLDAVGDALQNDLTIDEIDPILQSSADDEETAESLINAALERIRTTDAELSAEAAWFAGSIANLADRTTDAITILQHAEENSPVKAVSHQIMRDLGFAYLVSEDYPASINQYSMLRDQPDADPGMRIEVLWRLSQAHESAGDTPAALSAIQAALRLNGTIPLLYYQLAVIQFKGGQSENAENTLTRSMQQFPGDTDHARRCRMLLISLYQDRSDWDLAIGGYEEIIKDFADDPATVRLAKLGMSAVYVEKGDYESGEAVLESLLAESPDDPGVNNDLGYLYADQGKNLEKAEKMIRLAVESSPQNASYLDSLGWVLYRLKRFDEARKYFEDAISRPSGQDATIYEHLGDVEAAESKMSAARGHWRRALEIEEDDRSPDRKVLDRLREKLGDEAAPEEKAPGNEDAPAETPDSGR